MTQFGASLSLALLLAWGVQGVLGFAVAPLWSVALGGVAGAALSVLFARRLVARGAVALLAPFGVMLPALALGAMLEKIGVAMPGFSSWELVVFLAGYTVFLLSAFGVIATDLYRLGYAPLPVAAMVVITCVYAALGGNWFLAAVAVAGQLFWVLKWGSSNWFDYVLHVLLWPVACFTLLIRLM